MISIATGQEMVREKILQGQGKVRDFFLESGKIFDILKKNQRKLKYVNTAVLIPLNAEGDI